MHAIMSHVVPAQPTRRMAYFGPLQARAQRLAALLRGQAEVVWEGPGLAAPNTANPGPWSVVFVDFDSQQLDASGLLAGQLSQAFPHVPLVGVGAADAQRADTMLAAIRAGACDFITYDASAEELATVLARLERPARAPAPDAQRSIEPAALLVLLLGARAGLGVSTLAAHLAVMCEEDEAPVEQAEAAPNRMLLLDLGQPAGDAALYLNSTNTDFHVRDALQHVSRLDPTMARTAISRHPSGVAVLGQPPTDPHPAPGQDLAPLVERLRKVYSTILCDLGGTPVQHISPALFARADEIWLVTDQSIGALMSTDMMLHQIRQLNLSEHRIRLVVNRCDDSEGMSPSLIASRFSIPLVATLPDRSRTLRACANRGVLLQHEFPRDPYLRAVRALKDRLFYTRPRPPQPVSGWRALASRLGLNKWIRG
jgi:pilus assembly protein CpaE